MASQNLIVERRRHRAGRIEQVERAAAEPPNVPRHPRLIPRLCPFLSAQKIDDGAFARVGNPRHHKAKGAVESLCLGAVPLFFRHRGKPLHHRALGGGVRGVAFDAGAALAFDEFYEAVSPFVRQIRLI